MDLSQLHFAHPLWLWAMLAIPLIGVLYFLFDRHAGSHSQLEAFIDRHLLPYLVVKKEIKERFRGKSLLLWILVWGCLTLALAGPRWNFREIETFSKDQSLVILLDLSESMNAADVKPSRLVRAKQKIEDLLTLSKGVKIGLIAFAADPHMITPLTEDKETIRHLLPTLDTGLVHVQGSKLAPALEMASLMLNAEDGSNKALVVISDGGFEDSSALMTAKKLAQKGIIIHVIGVGTTEGAPIQNHSGNVIKKNGIPVFSKLDKEKFSEISKVGNGHYLIADYGDQGISLILNELDRRAEAQIASGTKKQIWEERFYLFLLPALPIFLWWFRRGAILATLLMLFMPSLSLHAEMADYFKNAEQRGEHAFVEGDYQSALDCFQDPYKKGVSCYRAGKYEEAEKLFRHSARPEVASNAGYNLGNSLVHQNKLKEAITAYEEVLKKWPDHTKAKENLEIVKKMLEQQQQQQQQNQQQDQEDREKKDPQDKDKDNQDQKEDQSQKNDQSQKDHQNQEGSEKEKPSEGNQNPEKPETQEESETKDPQKDPQEDAREKEEQPQPPQTAPEEEQKPQEAQSGVEVEQPAKSQADHDADLWLNRLETDPKPFMKNKFYIESTKNRTQEGVDPW